MTEQLNPTELAALDKAATPGPWDLVEAESMKYLTVVQFRYQSGQAGTAAMVGKGVTVGASDLETQNATAELITYLRNHVPAILAQSARIEALEATLKLVLVDRRLSGHTADFIRAALKGTSDDGP